MILNFFKKYVTNFFVWWYLVKGMEILRSLWRFWLFVLIFLRVWTMLTHLFSPMYQMKDITSRFVAFPIRLVWVVVGLFIQILLSGAIIIIYLAYLMLPILPIVLLVNYVLNL